MWKFDISSATEKDVKFDHTGAIHEKHNFKYFKNPTVKFGEMMSICIFFTVTIFDGN
jgi:hypothetical protein